MTNVTLRKEKRYFVSDDTDFTIQVPEVKDLPEKYLRSYSIKHALFHGDFKIVEGYFIFKFKAAMVYVAENILYAREYGKYFMKDLEIDTITYVDDDQVPAEIAELMTKGETIIKEPKVEKPKVEEVTESAELSAELPEVVEEEELPKTRPKPKRRFKR